MKFFAAVALIVCLAAACSAASYGGGAAAGGYGAASIPAPPCPKNYLFSCQPNLAPAPCAPAAAGGYGGAGSYSQQYPVYSFPKYFNNYENKAQLDEN